MDGAERRAGDGEAEVYEKKPHGVPSGIAIAEVWPEREQSVRESPEQSECTSENDGQSTNIVTPSYRKRTTARVCTAVCIAVCIAVFTILCVLLCSLLRELLCVLLCSILRALLCVLLCTLLVCFVLCARPIYREY